MKRRLYAHQIEAFKKLSCHNRFALFMEMRLGKTLVVIRRLSLLKKCRTLIVAPGSAIGSWEEELEKEGITDVGVLLGDRKSRVVELSFGKRWNLINKEGFLALPEISSVPWDALVLDESTFIKNPRAKVTKFFIQHFRSTPIKYILTGTPNPEGDLDLVCQFLFLNGELGGIHNYWTFRDKMCRPGYRKWEYHVTRTGKSVISHAVKTSSIVVKRSSVGLDVPKVTEARTLTFPPVLAKAYKTLERDFVYELEGQETEWHIYNTTQYVQLRRMCDGLGADGSLVWDGKIKEIVDLMKGELRGQKVVIWFVFKWSLYYCYTALSKAGIPVVHMWGDLKRGDREENRRAFQDGDAQVLLSTCAVAETGTNLSVADTAIYYSEPPGLQTRQQTEDRILVAGSSVPLLYVCLTTKGGVDRDVHEALKYKAWRSDKTLKHALIETVRSRVCDEDN